MNRVNASSPTLETRGRHPLDARHTLILILLALLLSTAPAAGQVLRPELWTANGIVEALAMSGGVVYVGGSFSEVRPVVGNAAVIQTGAGTVETPYMNVEGTVAAVVSDGSGGWYVGGSFALAGGAARMNLAHFDATGNVTAWNPGANDAIYVLHVFSGVLYVGGDFTFIAGQDRRRLAAFDVATGTIRAWDPRANASVRTVRATTSAIYAGGGFTEVGGQARNYLAALDPVTAAATAWNPNPNSSVLTMVFGVSLLWVGGDFTSIGGQSRNFVAALDLTTGNATSWNPGADGSVHSLGFAQLVAFPGTITIFVGGSFTQLAGASRGSLGAVDGTTGAATSWNPSANGSIDAMLVRTTPATGAVSAVYVGGNFTFIAGQPRGYLAALNASGAATTWNPGASNQVLTLAFANGFASMCAGGLFTAAGRVVRNCLAAFDVQTGVVTSWNPSPDNSVRALLVHGGKLYVSGMFNQIAGETRRSIAAFDLATGSLAAWNPQAFNTPFLNAEVNALAARGGAIYAGGLFNIMGGDLRDNIAALDTTSGLVTSWNPGANGVVRTLATTQRLTFPNAVTIFAGGGFTQIGGQARRGLASIDEFGPVTVWNPAPNDDINSLAVTTSRVTGAMASVYIGGEFTQAGGQSRNRIAEILPDGLATSWNPNAAYIVTAVTAAFGVVYAGGLFGSIGGPAHSNFAALDPTTGAATEWTPLVNGPVSAIATDGNGLYIGGYFGSVGGRPRANLAGFTHRLVAVEPGPAAPRGTIRSHPNPSHGEVALHFSLPTAGEAEVDVFDINGTRVRALHRATLGAGDQRLRWDGLDDGGRSVAPGLYLVRVRAPGGSQRAKVVRW